MGWKMKAVTRRAPRPSVLVGRIQRHEAVLACGEVMRQTRPISVEGYKPLAGQGACTQGEAEYAQGIEQELRRLDSRLCIFRGTLRRTVRGFRKKLFFGFPGKTENRKVKSEKRFSVFLLG